MHLRFLSELLRNILEINAILNSIGFSGLDNIAALMDV